MFLEKFLENYNCKIIQNKEKINEVKYTGLISSNQQNVIAYVVNNKLLKSALSNPAVQAVLIPEALLNYVGKCDKCLILCENPEEVYYALHNQPLFLQSHKNDGFIESYISASANIHPTAIIAENVHIGDNVTVAPYAVIGKNTYIGDNTYVGPHCVISEDGLYVRKFQEGQKHITHFGGVKIGKNCRIGAHSTIGRAVYFKECTVVEDNVILGYMTVISHEASIGEGTQVSSQSLVAGRTKIGKNTWIGAGATVSNSIEIGENSFVRIGSVVINSLPEKSNVSGNFAISHKKNLSNMLK